MLTGQEAPKAPEEKFEKRVAKVQQKYGKSEAIVALLSTLALLLPCFCFTVALLLPYFCLTYALLPPYFALLLPCLTFVLRTS